MRARRDPCCEVFLKTGWRLVSTVVWMSVWSEAGNLSTEPGNGAMSPGEKLEGKACDDCNSIPGYSFNPGLILKVFIAFVLGTIVFFSLLFAYKLWSFTKLPYYLSPYYGGDSFGGETKNRPGKFHTKSRSAHHSENLLLQLLADAKNKYFGSA